MMRTPLDKVMPQFDLEAPASDEDEGDLEVWKPFDLEAELPSGGPREQVTSRIGVVLARLSTAIVETGKDLIAIREIIKAHGKRGAWSRFLASGLPFSESAARNYIAAAEMPTSATVAEIALLKPTAMYAMARAPREIRREVEASLGDDVVPTTAKIQDMVKEHEAQSSVHKQASPEQDNADPASQTARLGQVSSAQEARTNRVHSAADKSETAAKELLAQLREPFADSDIRRLNRLWRTAGFARIQQILDESASMKSQGSTL